MMSRSIPCWYRAIQVQHRHGAGTHSLAPQHIYAKRCDRGKSKAKGANWFGQINNSEKTMFLQNLFMLMKICWTVDSSFQARQLLTQLLLQILSDVSSGYFAKLETSEVIAQIACEIKLSQVIKRVNHQSI